MRTLFIIVALVCIACSPLEPLPEPCLASESCGPASIVYQVKSVSQHSGDLCVYDLYSDQARCGNQILEVCGILHRGDCIALTQHVCNSIADVKFAAEYHVTYTNYPEPFPTYSYYQQLPQADLYQCDADFDLSVIGIDTSTMIQIGVGFWVCPGLEPIDTLYLYMPP